MKIVISALALILLLQNSVFAYEKSGPCAEFAAKAASEFATSYWSKELQKIDFSRLTPSSNSYPTQIYDVGILKGKREHLVQFDVALDYIRGKCINIEVRFAEYAE